MPTLPPSAVQAEEALLGAIMLQPLIFGDVVKLIDASDFYKPDHSTIFEAMDQLYRRGEPPDAVTLADQLRRTDQLDAIGGPTILMDLQSTTPAISRAGSYTKLVIETSRLRRILQLQASIAERCYDPAADPDAIYDAWLGATGDRRLLPREVKLPDDYTTAAVLRDLVAEDVAHGEWVVPQILRKMWRVLVVGTEGSAKSTIFRQVATLVANGLHPFVGGGSRIKPRRCLIIDAENPLDVIGHQFDLIDERGSAPLSRSQNLWIWRLEGGIDFRQRHPQMQLEAVLQDCKPELVTIGPVYKIYANGRDDAEQAAIDFLTFIDGLRKRFNFALMMEHHVPKGYANDRDLVPFGTSAWLRWPEFGIKLMADRETIDDKRRPHTVKLDRFRGDRIDAVWPLTLTRDNPRSAVPWLATWPDHAWDGDRMVGDDTPPIDDEEEF